MWGGGRVSVSVCHCQLTESAVVVQSLSKHRHSAGRGDATCCLATDHECTTDASKWMGGWGEARRSELSTTPGSHNVTVDSTARVCHKGMCQLYDANESCMQSLALWLKLGPDSEG
jgi:ribosome modulation factor